MALARRTRIQATVVAAALLGNTGVAAVALASTGNSSPDPAATVELALAAEQAPRPTVEADSTTTSTLAPVTHSAPAPKVPAAPVARSVAVTSTVTAAPPKVPAAPAKAPREISPAVTSKVTPARAPSAVLRGVQLEALELIPSPTQVMAVVSGCVDGLMAVLPVPALPGTQAPTSTLPGIPIVGELLGGNLFGGLLGGNLMGGLVPGAPVGADLPDLPDPAAITAAVQDCLDGVLELVPDVSALTGALAPLSALSPTQLAGLGVGGLQGLGGLDLDSLLELVTTATGLATSGTPDPTQLLDLLTGVLAGNGSVLAPLQAVLPLLGGLTDLPTGASAAGPALTIVQQVLGSLSGLLPVAR